MYTECDIFHFHGMYLNGIYGNKTKQINGKETIFSKRNINYVILKYTNFFPYYIINITGVEQLIT